MIRKQKDDIRQFYMKKRKDLPEAEKSLNDARICKTALSLVSFRHAEVILMYAPTKYEIDIMPIMEAALSKGKAVAFPKCDTENHTMTYHLVTSKSDLVKQAYNIREPSPTLPVYDPQTDPRSAVCLVPGLVFDKSGYRLGYGKGYYDRYLPAFSGCKVGIIYTSFILPSVPKGRFDLTTDILLTEKGVKIPGDA